MPFYEFFVSQFVIENSLLLISGVLFIAFCLDCLLGETRHFHPLIGFGNLVYKIENNFNKSINQQTSQNTKLMIKQRLIGSCAWLVLTLPLPIGYYFLRGEHWAFWLLDAVILYLAIGYRSLVEHAAQIAKPLATGDMQQARHFCGYIVSRDTSQLTDVDISRATTESVLENGHDAVIASLVCYAIGGIPLVILHRLANTLDAMWGYKNPRFLHFGWCAARMDDALGWPTAKISSLLYALQGNVFLALKNAYQQGRQYKSLNGGWCMASGATALSFSIGGRGIYHGKEIETVTLGQGPQVQSKDINRSLKLVRNAALIFIVITFIASFIISTL